jgi:hypothetical protein
MVRLWIALVAMIATSGALAQETPAAPVGFDEQVAEHGEAFRWIDLADMRSVRASLQAAQSQTATCLDGDCPDFDCPAANGSLAQVAELYMRLTAMENALAYMHTLELAHLRNLHEGANLSEEEAAYQNEVLFWQGAVITQAAALVQTALIMGDLESLVTADGPLATASAIDEVLRDTLTLHQDMARFRSGASPRFQARTDNLEQTIVTLTDFKSNAENVLNAVASSRSGEFSEAQEQLVISLGRNVRSLALNQLALRQAEVAQLNADAFTERAQANDFAERLRALSLQREYTASLADDAFALYLGLAGCVQSQCAIRPVALPEPPRTLRPAEVAAEDNRPRIDQAALRTNSDRIILLGDRLSPDWVRPQCDAPEPDDTVANGEARSGAGLAETGNPGGQDCQTIENVGICEILTRNRREECRASARTAIEVCRELPAIGLRFREVAPMSAALDAAIADMCRAQCTFQYGIDTHLDAQRLVALDQVAALERDHLRRGGEPLDSAEPQDDDSLRQRIRDIRTAAAARTRLITYDPATGLYARRTELPPGHILVAREPGELTDAERREIAGLQDQLDGEDIPAAGEDWEPQSAWGEEAAAFWRNYGPHQLLQCGGAEIDRRYQQCLAGCDNGGMGVYAACAIPAIDQSFNPGPALYPPGDERRDAIPHFNTREALNATRRGPQ